MDNHQRVYRYRSGETSYQEENLWIWLELIDANIIPYDLLVAAKERADKARAQQISHGHIWTNLPPRLQ
jgi:hypothetical protein